MLIFIRKIKTFSSKSQTWEGTFPNGVFLDHELPIFIVCLYKPPAATEAASASKEIPRDTVSVFKVAWGAHSKQDLKTGFYFDGAGSRCQVYCK
jgi:hypothetical protein